jgi:hypothetical protein
MIKDEDWECAGCAMYAYSRGPRIRSEIAERFGEAEVEERWMTFMEGVHERHAEPLEGFTAGRFVALMSIVQELIEADEETKDG